MEFDQLMINQTYAEVKMRQMTSLQQSKFITDFLYGVNKTTYGTRLGKQAFVQNVCALYLGFEVLVNICRLDMTKIESKFAPPNKNPYCSRLITKASLLSYKILTYTKPLAKFDTVTT